MQKRIYYTLIFIKFFKLLRRNSLDCINIYKMMRSFGTLYGLTTKVILNTIFSYINVSKIKKILIKVFKTFGNFVYVVLWLLLT